jgi:hypothetical protein
MKGPSRDAAEICFSRALCIAWNQMLVEGLGGGGWGVGGGCFPLKKQAARLYMQTNPLAYHGHGWPSYGLNANWY